MGWTVRQTGLLAPVFGCLISFCLFDACAFAQAPVQPPASGKDASPFDWLRHDAPAVNRPGGPTLNPPMEGAPEPKRPEAAQPVMDEPTPPVVTTGASGETVSPPEEALAPGAPSPMPRPVMAPVNHASAKAKTLPPLPTDQIEVVNNRNVTLNELKLMSLRNSRKPFILRPSLKAGQTIRIEIPRDWGCVFLVWTQFSEEPSEQYDGVDLCTDRKLNLIN